ncbi:hypothetical protein F2Q68_00017073 [Brassica cretica]|uniref:USP domain-containing protein n=1 Tax=Brassica cretica TaxID=69181 RepID=A0A8S9HT52_BRACR|nr:hypothetical protein F2Q68_00017073 [Brassica cretica]
MYILYLIYYRKLDSILNSNILENEDQTRDEEFRQRICRPNGTKQQYFSHQSLKLAFEMAPADPTLDLNMQLTKLGHGLLSGKYSIPVTEKDAATAEARQEGIPPRMFKSVVAAGHGEFSSMRQQDALDFFLHLLDKVERGNNTRPDLDPSRSFKFGVEEKILCSSGKVSYNKRDDCILSLNIPLQEATNKDELEAFNNQTAGKGLEENNMSTDEIVRPRVPLEACLATFASPEQIHDYYSTALKGKTTAIKYDVSFLSES